MANIGRPSEYIKTLEAKEIITRDMKLYTYIELHSSIGLVEKSFINDCEQRREYKRCSTNESYFKNIEEILKIKINLFIKNDDKFFNHLNKIATKEIIKNEEQSNYLIFLLYSYYNGIFSTHIQKEDIYINSFSVFEHIKNQIRDYLENLNEGLLETFNTIQLLSNKNANILKYNMLNANLYDDNINQIFSSFIDYSLVHNESSKLNEDSHYLQIDLSNQDEDILRVIKLMRKELKIKKSEKHKTIRDGLTLGEKRANMLFAYDCLALGLSRKYIADQIQYYCYSEKRNFTLSNSKLDEYIKELKNLI